MKVGYGKHMWDVSQEQFSKYIYVSYPSSTSTGLSLLITYP